MTYTITNGNYVATITDRGAELISLKLKSGYECIWNDPQGKYWNGHVSPLFPTCGRLLNGKYTYKGKEYELGCHGFMGKEIFTVVEKTESSVTLCLTENEYTLSVYPFPFKATVTYGFEESRLTLSVLIENTGKETLPYMFGWHPGFTLPSDNGQCINDYKLDFYGASALSLRRIQPGNFVAPTSEPYHVDNGVWQVNEDTIENMATVILYDHANKVKMYSDKGTYALELGFGKNLPAFCIWKPYGHDAKLLCLEPWSDVPSSGNEPECFDTRKMSRLAPGESEIYKFNVEITE